MIGTSYLHQFIVLAVLSFYIHVFVLCLVHAQMLRFQYEFRTVTIMYMIYRRINLIEKMLIFLTKNTSRSEPKRGGCSLFLYVDHKNDHKSLSPTILAKKLNFSNDCLCPLSSLYRPTLPIDRCRFGCLHLILHQSGCQALQHPLEWPTTHHTIIRPPAC